MFITEFNSTALTGKIILGNLVPRGTKPSTVAVFFKKWFAASASLVSGKFAVGAAHTFNKYPNGPYRDIKVHYGSLELSKLKPYDVNDIVRPPEHEGTEIPAARDIAVIIVSI